jgi:hypothetical protein
MRGGLLGAALLLMAIAGASATAQQAPAPATTAAPTPVEAVELALRQQLLASQQEVARLQAALADQAEQQAQLARCRDKNARLAAIGSELIAAYQKRYRRGQFLPFDAGRRKFEAELQDQGDRLYDNRLDAAPRPPAAPPVPAESPGPAQPANPPAPPPDGR